jgi:hypothetical protein
VTANSKAETPATPQASIDSTRAEAPQAEAAAPAGEPTASP